MDPREDRGQLQQGGETVKPFCPYCGFTSPWSCDRFTCPKCHHNIDVDDGDMYD